MRQGLYTQPDAAINAVIASGLMISVCNIQQLTGATNAMGQVDTSDWVDVAGLTGLQCQFSVQLPGRPDQGDVARLQNQTDVKNEFHVLLGGYYPGILQRYTAVIDGIRYQIQTAESDSQKTQTRMAVRVWSL